jgi:hypothetical protein
MQHPQIFAVGSILLLCGRVAAATTPRSFLVGGADDCVSAEPISGVGTFSVDTIGATTGAQQAGSCPTADNDVWFAWTCPSAGIATFSTCGGVPEDSVIAAYQGAGCPTGTNLIACNNNACGIQSSLSFRVSAGSVYTLQLGGVGATTTYSGTFTLSVAVAPANDSCSAPNVVTGLGPHDFDNTFATTGTEGQAEALCAFFGFTAIAHDVWYTWTAPATGGFSLNTCFQTTVSTKLAVYDGAGCPTAAAIACNELGCSAFAHVCFDATSGQTYTIQLGTHLGQSGGTGTFTFASTAPLGACDPQDDGSSEQTVGYSAGGGLGWLNQFGAAGTNTAVTAIRTTFGTPLLPGGAPPAGTPFQVAVWDDPNDDGDCTDAVLQPGSVTTATIDASSIDTDVFQNVGIPATTVHGIFFVGVVLLHAAGELPAALDLSTGATMCGSPNADSWLVANTTGPLDLVNLSANDVPPLTVASFDLYGNWLLRIDCAPIQPGAGYCFGDGSGMPCPCANSGSAGHGCANSVNTAGALLAATGNAQVSNDTLVLHGSGMPNQNCLYFQGNAQVSSAFGDGLRCVRGTVTRIGMKTNVAGASQYPGASDPRLSVVGAIPAAGGTRNYQVWYLNTGFYCLPSQFNFTNGLQVVWSP